MVELCLKATKQPNEAGVPDRTAHPNYECFGGFTSRGRYFSTSESCDHFRLHVDSKLFLAGEQPGQRIGQRSGKQNPGKQNPG